MAQEKEKLKEEKQAFQLLINAFNTALKGAAAEADAFKKAKTAGMDDFNVKLKLFEAKELLLTAQEIVKDKADILLGRLFRDFREGRARDFDLLRNQINHLCIELLDVKKEQINTLIQVKEEAQKKAALLIEKLNKELGS